MHEEKFKTLEEEGSDALEVAAQAHEEREAQTPEEVSSSITLFIFSIHILRLRDIAALA
jgi:hypothetical protein